MSSGEGSLQAPTRQAIDWKNPDFADPVKLDEEMRRVFDICHGCRRCFNLCDSFPRLFDLIDGGANEDVESLASEDFKPVVEACTLCDMCFMTKCPYVPPHPFMLDFPHLMLRHRFVEAKNGHSDFTQNQLAQMDRNGALSRATAPVINWAGQNKPMRTVLEKTVGIDAKATLPKFAGRTFVLADKQEPNQPNVAGPAFGKRKAAQMLKLIPDTPVDVIERCSGHGGTFGVVKPTHDLAVKVGRPVFRAANSQKRGHIVSDCPLAAQHIVANTDTGVTEPEHPVQIMARAFGLTEK